MAADSDIISAPVRRPARRLPGWAAWAIGAALVATAWLVALVTPGEEQPQGPFPVAAVVGEQAAGRNISATITDLRRASTVTADGWSADGNWLVVDLDAAAVVSEHGASLRHAFIEIDGVRYSASDRPDSLVTTALAAGIPRSGSLAFELPADLETGTGTLELALAPRGDVRGDSMIVLSFDLADVPVADETELRETGWVSP
jgi:hypothetical protein